MTRSLIGQGKYRQQPYLRNTHVPATGTQTWGTSRSISRQHTCTRHIYSNIGNI
uniref:Uncharacterized protein n=1 Tax=Arundo donax TaxID=35708 RepID=A0A0A9BRA4_ARUDO